MLPTLVARLSEPLLVHPDKVRAILHGQAPRFGLDQDLVQPPRDARWSQPRERGAMQNGADENEAEKANRRQAHGYQMAAGGVAVVPIHGGLAKRVTNLEAVSDGLISYEAVEARFAAALSDRETRAVVLDIDTPGGEAAGVDTVAQRVYEARGTVPVVAVANEFAASAGYWIAAAADEVVTSRLGGVGSVGVVLTHMDYSGMAEGMGVTVTHLYRGARKIDGTPWKPLEGDARENIEQKVQGLYDTFVMTVAAYRGMSAEAVRATQADLLAGDEAVQAGLADRVGSLAETVDRLSEQQQEMPMTRSNEAGGSDTAARTDGGGIEEPLTVDPNAMSGDNRGEDPRVAERKRIAAILEADAAKGRAGLAHHLALHTDMAPEAAQAALAAAPIEQTADAKADETGFVAMMNGTPNPDVQPEDGGGQHEADADLAALRQAGIM